MRLVVRILGADVLEIDTGAAESNNATSYSSANAQTEATFGFVPASVEYDRPQP